MLKIDAHQHFWKYNPDEYDWINDEMPELKRNYLPDQLQKHLKHNGFDGCIAVQARQSEEENDFLSGLAQDYPFIKGVIGWTDLQSEDIEEKLESLIRNPVICGIRHLVQDEPDPRFMLNAKFMRGISCLKKYGFCYDILIRPGHLPVAEEFVKRFPDQKFVIDHIGKPDIKKHILQPWKDDIERIARHPNVCCKLSGMVTEAEWRGWQKSDFLPYLDVVFEAFGAGRLMIGSDWPVCTLSAEYDEALGIINDYLSVLSTDEQEKVLGGNAVRIYKLNGNG